MDHKLTILIALQRAIAQRNWDEVEKEIGVLTETIVDDCTRPVIKRVYRPTVPIFSHAVTRYHGNSGLSGGCMPAAA